MVAPTSAVSQRSTIATVYCWRAERCPAAPSPKSASSARRLPRARNKASRNEQHSSQGEISTPSTAAPAAARRTKPKATIRTSTRKTRLSAALAATAAAASAAETPSATGTGNRPEAIGRALFSGWRASCSRSAASFARYTALAAAQKIAKVPSSRSSEARSNSLPPNTSPAKTKTFLVHCRGRSASTSAAVPVRREMAAAGVATGPILRLEDGPRRGPALQLAIALPGGVRRPVERESPVVEHGGPRAQLARGRQRVGHEHEGDSRGAEVLDAPLALLLEPLVAHGEHLVDDEDVRLDVLRDGESQARIHARGIVLHRQVDEVAQLAEVDDALELRLHLLAREAEQRAVQVDVVAAGQLGIEARAELDHRADPPLAQRPELLRRAQVPEAVRHRLLQGGDLLAVDAVPDADVLEDDLPVAHLPTGGGCGAARAA